MNGLFITFEGGEGAGKTTVLQIVKEQLEERGLKVIATREPGGSVIAEKIREIILNPEHTEMDARTEALLYAAARRQHLIEKIVPYLEDGYVILCDRFIDSSLVYQGEAREIGIEEVLNINLFATEGLMPEMTLYFDIEPETGLARIHSHQGREVNRLDQETISFHEMVREAYRKLAAMEPERIHLLDASLPLDAVVKEAGDKIESILQKQEKR